MIRRLNARHHRRLADSMRSVIRSHKKHGPPVIGLQGVQGIGKSYACEEIRRLLSDDYVVVALSLDDFYKPYEELYGEVRGRPGTHDVPLLLSCLNEFVRGAPVVELPVYDKSARNGLGDRAAATRRVAGPVDAILLEGWCLGFEPVDTPPTSLRHVNDQIRTYAHQLHPCLAFLYIIESPLEHVFELREASERARRDAGEGAMTPDETKTFVDHYMEVYLHYLPALREQRTPTKIHVHV